MSKLMLEVLFEKYRVHAESVSMLVSAEKLVARSIR